MKKSNKLNTKLSSSDPDEIYDAIIDIGKEWLQEYEDKIASFLSHEDAMLRSGAIRVLGFYWKLDKYKSVAKDMLLNDEDEETRSVALMSFSAYLAIFAVSQLPKADWPKHPDFENLDEELDYNLVEKLIGLAG